ncbi:hypothetical protein V1478_013832 [Vespula squamosa]|uniref:Uncharacterized protein n=1 Tax=Vespula squamosa TaxID=30214 RepID=A0ABD2A6C6_VESSQ
MSEVIIIITLNANLLRFKSTVISICSNFNQLQCRPLPHLQTSTDQPLSILTYNMVEYFGAIRELLK